MKELVDWNTKKNKLGGELRKKWKDRKRKRERIGGTPIYLFLPLSLVIRLHGR